MGTERAFVVYIDQGSLAGPVPDLGAAILFRQCMFNKTNNTRRLMGCFVNYIENAQALV
jgi:hypothetical protein